MLVYRTAGCPNGERDEHADTSGEKADAAANAVNKERCTKGDEPLPDGEATVDVGLSYRFRDAYCVEDLRELRRVSGRQTYGGTNVLT